MNPIKFYKGLRDHFNIISAPNKYLCETSLISGKVKIDIIKFDTWLHKEHGDYENDLNISMANLVTKKYGISARVFIEEYI